MWGAVNAYVSLLVLIPLAVVAWRAGSDGASTFAAAVLSPQALAALGLSVGESAVVMVVNAIAGTSIAWVLVRDQFPGKPIVNALIDLPFALPTVVAGLTLATLYGPRGPLGIDVAYSRVGVGLALLFVTLPFVVRAVQPVLVQLDREMEDAAASLGANDSAIFRRIVLPNIAPAVLSGMGLGFARAMGEFGSVVLLSGNIPFSTEVGAVYVFGQVESGRVANAAAVSVALLGVSLAVLVLLSAVQHWASKHDKHDR